VIAAPRAPGLTSRLGILVGFFWGLALPFICTTSIFWTLVLFEGVLLLALKLLLLSAKGERILEAAVEMFLWTVVGSWALVLVIVSLLGGIGGGFSVALLVIIGFGVKVPLWPFASWLLKAHVEASVEFSILLSGFIVKLGVIGLWRVMGVVGWEYGAPFLLPLGLIGLCEAALRLFAQVDLKRIVALTTVLEMN
jgi:NAD(P)H-quinone oxidoreductase subunit 4